MSFSVTGMIGKKSYHVQWSPAGLGGDQHAVELVTRKAEALAGTLVGPTTGPFTDKDHLADPLSALFVMTRVFDKITETAGDVPEAPHVPEGAIA